VWIKALTAAAKGEHLAPVIDYDYYYRVLGLDPEEHHEPSVVNRAFRTLVAEAPVGKDGKAEGVSLIPLSQYRAIRLTHCDPFLHTQFKELQEAFNHIMAHLNDIEEAQLFRMAFYEAVVIKVADLPVAFSSARSGNSRSPLPTFWLNRAGREKG
jgi:hypothetical protein